MRAQRRLCGRSWPGCSAPAALPARTRGCLPWRSCLHPQHSKNCGTCQTLLAHRSHCLTRCGSSSGSEAAWLYASW